jgi:hypothetical protein
MWAHKAHKGMSDRTAETANLELMERSVTWVRLDLMAVTASMAETGETAARAHAATMALRAFPVPMALRAPRDQQVSRALPVPT